MTLVDLWAEGIQECYAPGVTEFFCPMDDDITLIPMSRNVLCQVCTAQGFTDSDPRYGFVTGRIFFGPNQKDGFVDESVLWGYRLSFIDDCGADLAEIGKVGKRDYPPAICCDPERYSFGLEGVPVPAGATAIQIAPYKGNWRLLGGVNVSLVDFYISSTTTTSLTQTYTTSSTSSTSNSTTETKTSTTLTSSSSTSSSTRSSSVTTTWSSYWTQTTSFLSTTTTSTPRTKTSSARRTAADLLLAIFLGHAGSVVLM